MIQWSEGGHFPLPSLAIQHRALLFRNPATLQTSLTWTLVFWSVVWNILFFHLLGISSSQLTNSYFSEGLKPSTSFEFQLIFSMGAKAIQLQLGQFAGAFGSWIRTDGALRLGFVGDGKVENGSSANCQDRRLLMTLLLDYYNPEVLKPGMVTRWVVQSMLLCKRYTC